MDKSLAWNKNRNFMNDLVALIDVSDSKNSMRITSKNKNLLQEVKNRVTIQGKNATWDLSWKNILDSEVIKLIPYIQ